MLQTYAIAAVGDVSVARELFPGKEMIRISWDDVVALPKNVMECYWREESFMREYSWA